MVKSVTADHHLYSDRITIGGPCHQYWASVRGGHAAVKEVTMESVDALSVARETMAQEWGQPGDNVIVRESSSALGHQLDGC